MKHPRPQPDNVLVFLVDQFRQDYLDCNGDTQIRTPNLDRLWDEAIRRVRRNANGA